MTGSPEFLTVRELAELLRIKERKVYDLASAGKVPCTRATGKLLFPEAEVRAWIDAKQSGKSSQRPAVFLGSHDPLLEWALRQSKCGMATFFDGSTDGVMRFRNGEGVASGLHIHDAASDDWNVSLVKREASELNAVLIAWATRKRGLVVKADAEAKYSSMQDVEGRRVALRQPNSGTAVLWTALLEDAGIAGRFVEGETCHSENDAVLAVAEGAADVTFGLEAVAHQFGLGFVPLVDERFDLLVDRAAYFEKPFQCLLTFCKSNAFIDRASALRGYDLAGLGEVRWNA